MPESLIDAAMLRRFESARLLARRQARGAAHAERRSHHRGPGVEFAEYRALVAGDDFRQIDWHAYARWRQLVVKLFVAESDLSVHLLLDCSRSMQAGAPPKFDLARQVLAGLAYIALGNLDRAGFVPLGAPDAAAVAPGRGRERFPSLVAAIEGCRTVAGALSIEEAVRRWLARSPRRGLVVLAGDGFGVGAGDVRRALERLRHAGHDAASVQVLDRAEVEPPPPGEYEVADTESGSLRRVVVDGAAAAAFKARAAAFLAAAERAARSCGAPFLRAWTHEPPDAVLARALAWT